MKGEGTGGGDVGVGREGERRRRGGGVKGMVLSLLVPTHGRLSWKHGMRSSPIA